MAAMPDFGSRDAEGIAVPGELMQSNPYGASVAAPISIPATRGGFPERSSSTMPSTLPMRRRFRSTTCLSSTRER